MVAQLATQPIYSSHDVPESSVQTKAGYVLLHSPGLLGGRWREVWLVLYSDSLLAWYHTEHRTNRPAIAGVRLRHGPDLLATGQFSARVPSRPQLPANVRIDQVRADSPLT